MESLAPLLPADFGGFVSALTVPCGEWLAFGVMLGLVFWALGLAFYCFIDIMRGGI